MTFQGWEQCVVLNFRLSGHQGSEQCVELNFRLGGLQGSKQCVELNFMLDGLQGLKQYVELNFRYGNLQSTQGTLSSEVLGWVVWFKFDTNFLSSNLLYNDFIVHTSHHSITPAEHIIW